MSLRGACRMGAAGLRTRLSTASRHLHAALAGAVEVGIMPGPTCGQGEHDLCHA
jgi:hypothetical protein